MDKSVLVDTSFLIILSDPDNEHYEVANKYFKYFLRPENKITLYLSTIVISEYHQRSSVLEWLKKARFITLPFNVKDALEVSNVAHNLGSTARAVTSTPGERAEFKDDIKLIAQAHANKVDFVITADRSTLARYIDTLHTTGASDVCAITISEGYDVSPFEGGQPTLPGIE